LVGSMMIDSGGRSAGGGVELAGGGGIGSLLTFICRLDRNWPAACALARSRCTVLNTSFC
jgi:hypothetical protein